MSDDKTRPAWRENLVPLIAAAILAVVAIGFRNQLIDWFTGAGRASHQEASGGHDHSGAGAGSDGEKKQSAKPAATHRYSDAARAEIVRALAAYETMRAELAGDRPDKLEAPAKAVAEALEAATAAETAPPPAIAAALERGRAAAAEITDAVDLDAARVAFGNLSEPIVTLALADPRVSENLHLFECPMAEGFNRWIQPSERLSNPYMGTKMLTCGSEIDPMAAVDHAGHDHAASGAGEIDHYTCPMETWVKEKKPGTCPVCGMDLVPVTVEEVRTGVLRVDHRRRQLIGLKTAKVERRPLVATIEAVGRVTYDETRVADVTVRTGGFVRNLRVEALGERVRRGQMLFSLYSPELYTAQKEYLLALAQQKAASSEAGRARAAALVRGARQRLLLWEISGRQLERIAARGEAVEYLPITSPSSGYVVEKNVVEGASITAGERLFRIADLDKVWVEADVYEQDIGRVAVGQSAEVRLTHLAGKTYTGKVAFVYPYLDGKSRTARVRIELPNKGLELKPAMYADVKLSSDAGEVLSIPEAAVIYSGPRRIVFVDAGGDKLAPRLVKVGLKTGGYFEVLSGLEEGELVVTSGNFLLSAESRLKAATGLWND